MAALKQELNLLKDFFKDSNTIQKLRWDEDARTLYFAYNLGKRKLRMSFFVPHGYPSSSDPDDKPLLMEEDPRYEALVEKVNDYSRDESPSLTKTFEYFIEQFGRKFELKASRNVGAIAQQVEGIKPAAKKRGDDEEEEEEEEEGEEYEDFMDEEEAAGSKLLRQHVEELKELYGDKVAKYFPELSMVRLFVDVSFIPATTADALGLDPTTPINVTLHLSDTYLSAPHPPKFEVDQKPKQDSFGLQFQITEILRRWLAENWGKSTFHTSISLSSSSGGASSSSSASSSASSSKEKGFFSNLKGKVLGTKDADAYDPNKYSKQVKSLLDTGFDKDLCAYALHKTKGDPDAALGMLLEPSTEFLAEATQANEAFKSGVMKEKRSVLTKSQVNRNKENFLACILMYMRSRIGNCSNHCPICDKRHEFEGLKPIVCSNEACIWRYEELGLGANVNSEIVRAPEVIDLLITVALACAQSTRADTMFTPFPSDFISQDKKKDFELLKKVLADLPAVQELASAGDVRHYLDELDPNPPGQKIYYRLVRWLLTSNRAHLVRLKEDQQISAMSTPYQYMLLTAAPEREARFEQLKKQHGSFFAFHGSPMENWHPIMRTGLKNMSNTSNMLHGAAHGAGIYLAPNASTSGGYMRSGTGWSKSQFGSSVSCLALVEVIDHPDIYGRDHSQWCYVVKDEEHLITRFFFIYGNGGSVPGAIARQLTIPDKTALGF
ncbi:Protein mono-ADP-ribosyltransferase parp16 [Balamuthia mandrillaris]